MTPHKQSAKCIKQTEFSDVTKMMDLWATKACNEGVQLTGDILRVTMFCILHDSWRFKNTLHHFDRQKKIEYSDELIKLLTASSIFPHHIHVLRLSTIVLMVKHITSNTIVNSSDENEGAGHGGSGEISALSSSSSSGSENDSPSNHLEEVFDQILSGKTKSKGKKKTGATRGTNRNTSKYVPLSLTSLSWRCLRK